LLLEQPGLALVEHPLHSLDVVFGRSVQLLVVTAKSRDVRLSLLEKLRSFGGTSGEELLSEEVESENLSGLVGQQTADRSVGTTMFVEELHVSQCWSLQSNQLTSMNWSSLRPRLYMIGVLSSPLGKNLIVGKDRTSYLDAMGLFSASSAFIPATTQLDSEAKARATFS